MVYVIVETEKEDIGDIVTRLLGAKHKITVVDDLQTACGCVEQPTQPKRKRSTPPPTASCLVSSSKYTPITTINSFVVRRRDPEVSNDVDTFDDEEDEGDMTMDATAALMELFEDQNRVIHTQNGDDPQKMEKVRHRRNNGVPYNPGTLYPQIRGKNTESDEDQEKEEYQEGVDMAIRCMVCQKTIALGTRPANHSTRKYAHARSHGFSERFECSVCQAMFKNKRSIFNHHKTYHENDPNFRIIDTWSEESQRELMNMVKKCFPSNSKPFPKINDFPVNGLMLGTGDNSHIEDIFRNLKQEAQESQEVEENN